MNKESGDKNVGNELEGDRSDEFIMNVKIELRKINESDWLSADDFIVARGSESDAKIAAHQVAVARGKRAS